MSLTITLPSSVEARLQERALQENRATEELASSLLIRLFEDDEADRADEIEGIRRGLEAAKHGRLRPLEEFASEQRTKHGLPKL